MRETTKTTTGRILLVIIILGLCTMTAIAAKQSIQLNSSASFPVDI